MLFFLNEVFYYPKVALFGGNVQGGIAYYVRIVEKSWVVFKNPLCSEYL